MQTFSHHKNPKYIRTTPDMQTNRSGDSRMLHNMVILSD